MDAQKPRGELGRKLLARCRELDRPMQPAKQLAPDILFEPPDVPTDCGLRYAQLTGRVGEAEPSRRGLEGPTPMNFYASSVALLWTTAMRLGTPRAEVREADSAERIAASRRPACLGMRHPAGPAQDCIPSLADIS
jgi:hypothetical protein